MKRSPQIADETLLPRRGRFRKHSLVISESSRFKTHPQTRKPSATGSEDRSLRRNANSAWISGRTRCYLAQDHKGVRCRYCNQCLEPELRTTGLGPTLKRTGIWRLGYTEEATIPQERCGALSRDTRRGEAPCDYSIESASPLRLVSGNLRPT